MGPRWPSSRSDLSRRVTSDGEQTASGVLEFSPAFSKGARSENQASFPRFGSLAQKAICKLMSLGFPPRTFLSKRPVLHAGGPPAADRKIPYPHTAKGTVAESCLLLPHGTVAGRRLDGAPRLPDTEAENTKRRPPQNVR